VLFTPFTSTWSLPWLMVSPRRGFFVENLAGTGEIGDGEPRAGGVPCRNRRFPRDQAEQRRLALPFDPISPTLSPRRMRQEKFFTNVFVA